MEGWPDLLLWYVLTVFLSAFELNNSAQRGLLIWLPICYLSILNGFTFSLWTCLLWFLDLAVSL